MESLSKIPITYQAIQDIVHFHFGKRNYIKSLTELKEGFFNTAALIEMQDGYKCVIKAAPPENIRVLRYERDILRAEVEVLKKVKMETEVPVPEVVVYDPTLQLLPSPFFIMENLEGIPLQKIKSELKSDAQAEIHHQMGFFAWQLSRLTSDSYGYWAQPEIPGTSWRICFDKMLRGVIQNGIDMEVRISITYDEILDLAHGYYSSLDEVTTPRLVHWDLWDGNVFVNQQKLLITGIIDFERALWGDPLIEVIFMDLNPDNSCTKGFQEPVFTTQAQTQRRRLYNIYLLLIMVIECYYRRYPNQDQENWARFELGKNLDALKLEGSG